MNQRRPDALQERPLRGTLLADLSMPAPPHLDIHWLGQAGFALRDPSDHVILIDPYLSDSLAEKYQGRLFPHVRLMEAPIGAAEFPHIDLVLITHGHTDHMDPETLASIAHTHPAALFIVPSRELELAIARGIPRERVLGAHPGQSLTPIPSIRVAPVLAAHEELDVTAEGSRFLGYVVEMGGHRVYHSGDCVPFAGQAEELSILAPTIALLPVNGRDGYRRENGVPGNFTLTEALELCEAAGIADLVVHHWGMFDFNTIELGTLLGRKERYSGPVRWYIPSLTTSLQG